MDDYKELFEIQLKYINSGREAELVYRKLESLNNKLSRYENYRRKGTMNSYNTSDPHGKIRTVIAEIFDNYGQYNALDKKEIQETLSSIQKIVNGNLQYMKHNEEHAHIEETIQNEDNIQDSI